MSTGGRWIVQYRRCGEGYLVVTQEDDKLLSGVNFRLQMLQSEYVQRQLVPCYSRRVRRVSRVRTTGVMTGVTGVAPSTVISHRHDVFCLCL